MLTKETIKIYRNRIKDLTIKKDKIRAKIHKMHTDYAKDKNKYDPDRLGDLYAQLDDVSDDLSDLEWSIENNVE